MHALNIAQKCEQFPAADLVTFTEEIRNAKLHFLCCENWTTSWIPCSPCIPVPTTPCIPLLLLNVFSTYSAWLTKTVQSRRLKHWKVSLKRHPVSVKKPYILKHTYDLLVDTRYNRFKNRDTRIISQIYSKSAIRIPVFIPSYNMFRMLYCFC